jgi:hypothetical protein
MAIFLTLLVSAITLYYSDRDRLDKSSKVNYWGSRIVIIAYVVMNAVMIYRAV